MSEQSLKMVYFILLQYFPDTMYIVYVRGSPIAWCPCCVWGRPGQQPTRGGALLVPTYVGPVRLVPPVLSTVGNIKTGSQQSVICPGTCVADNIIIADLSLENIWHRITKNIWAIPRAADQFQWAALQSLGEVTAASCKFFFFVITPIWWNHPGVIMT